MAGRLAGSRRAHPRGRGPARLWTKGAGLVRFALRVRGMLRETISIEEASRRIEDGVGRRRERFLDKLETAVYANPRSPYRQLLAAAGCEMGDVKRLVETEDLEGALGRLERAGVHVSYEEFKGRTPAVRGSQTFHFRSDDFNEPLIGSPRRSCSIRTSATAG
jgi:HAMP domain-containing protein